MKLHGYSHEFDVCLYLRPAPVHIHHKIRGTGSESSLLLTAPDIVCPPSPPPPPPIAHTLCTISIFAELAAELIRGRLESTCLPAQAMSFTPSWALSITPQQQPLQETGEKITSPFLKRDISNPQEVFWLQLQLKRERRRIKDSLRATEKPQSDINMFSLLARKWTYLLERDFYHPSPPKKRVREMDFKLW